MGKLLALCGAVLLFSVAAAAQDNSNSGTPATSPAATAASPARYASSNLPGWQVGVNYSYIRFRSGTSFNMHGFNTTVTGYLNDWFGLEGDVGANFGTTPSKGGPGPFTAGNLSAKLILYGGGPHLAYRHGQALEPWVHAIFGGAHFRFAQTGAPTAGQSKINAFAYAVGVGADLKLGPHFAWRFQGDFLSTRFFSTWQKNAQAQTGIVINF